jgi:hypothetical protein
MKTIELSRQRGAGHDGEAVIREARRRQRRRQLIAGVAVVLALGGALGVFGAVSGSSRPRPEPAASEPGRALAATAGALGIGATVLMWPVGYPAFGPGYGPPAYLSDLATGRQAQRQIPGIIGCDCRPYLIAAGQQLVYAGSGGTTAIAADLTGKPRVLGATQFFAPSAAPGRVWLSYSRAGANFVRSVPVTGGPPGQAVWLPRGTWLIEGTDAGLLLQRQSGVLEIWNPGERPITIPYSDWYHGFAANARIIAYGTGCRSVSSDVRVPGGIFGYEACRMLNVFDVSTGRLDSFRAPHGTAGWVQSGIYGIGLDNAISPRNTMIAAEAVTSPRAGQARLFVLRLAGGHATARTVPSSAAFMTAMTAWSADGSWLFYQGPGGRLWAYQVATGRARRSTTPCCRYNAMVAIPSPP